MTFISWLNYFDFPLKSSKFAFFYFLHYIHFSFTRKGPAQARVSTDIFHDGLRRETCSDSRITLAKYPIIIGRASCPFCKLFKGYLRCGMILNV